MGYIIIIVVGILVFFTSCGYGIVVAKLGMREYDTKKSLLLELIPCVIFYRAISKRWKELP